MAHFVNGHSPLNHEYTVDHEPSDRDSTINSIKSSIGPRKVSLDVEALGLSDTDNAQPPASQNQTASARQYEEVTDGDIEDLDQKISARDTRDQAPLTPPPTTRSTTPSTQNPTIDFDGLSWPSVGTLSRLRERENPADAEARLAKLSGAVRTILECIGEDPDREGLHGTPERYAKAMMWFTKGYEENLRDIVNGAVFHEDHDELVIVKDIDVYSLCEHHLVPFTGKVSSCLKSIHLLAHSERVANWFTLAEE